MKSALLPILLALYFLPSQAQNSSPSLLGTWTLCLSDKTEDDLVLHRGKDDPACPTSWTEGDFTYVDLQEFTFYPGDSLTILHENGSHLRKGFVPDTIVTRTETYDTTLLDDGRMEITLKVQEIRTPVAIHSNGTAMSIALSSYFYDPKKEELSYMTTDLQRFKLIELNQTRLVLRKL